MRHISIRAVLSGMALGVLLDILSGVTVTYLLGPDAFAADADQAQVQAALEALSRSTPFLLASLVLGSLSTVAAGYLSARVARRLPYMNAAAVGVLGLLMGAWLADGTLPVWFNVAGFASVIPMALVGGHVAKRHG